VQYIRDNRSKFVTARLTPEDVRLVRAAAASRGASLSSYMADAATKAARRDLAQVANEDGER